MSHMHTPLTSTRRQSPPVAAAPRSWREAPEGASTPKPRRPLLVAEGHHRCGPLLVPEACSEVLTFLNVSTKEFLVPEAGPVAEAAGKPLAAMPL